MVNLVKLQIYNLTTTMSTHEGFFVIICKTNADIAIHLTNNDY